MDARATDNAVGAGSEIEAARKVEDAGGDTGAIGKGAAARVDTGATGKAEGADADIEAARKVTGAAAAAKPSGNAEVAALFAGRNPNFSTDAEFRTSFLPEGAVIFWTVSECTAPRGTDLASPPSLLTVRDSAVAAFGGEGSRFTAAVGLLTAAARGLFASPSTAAGAALPWTHTPACAGNEGRVPTAPALFVPVRLPSKIDTAGTAFVRFTWRIPTVALVALAGSGWLAIGNGALAAALPWTTTPSRAFADDSRQNPVSNDNRANEVGSANASDMAHVLSIRRFTSSMLQ